jgi:hypothetical protein
MTKYPKKQKFFAYVDESGQDTKGKFFVVSVLILETDKQNLWNKLEKIEILCNKRKKWTKTRPKFKQKYIEKLLKINQLKKTLYFKNFTNQQYLKFTAIAIAEAIFNKTGRDKNYNLTIYIDGLVKAELEKIQKELKKLNVKIRKLRGVKKDENNAFIRLTDAICGLVREVERKNNWANHILQELKNLKIIKEL